MGLLKAERRRAGLGGRVQGLVLPAPEALSQVTRLSAKPKRVLKRKMTPAQRKAAIKDLQIQTNWQAQ